MITCEKCKKSYSNSQVETTQVELRDKSKDRSTLCTNCWKAIHPGDWVMLPAAEEEEKEREVRRLYWPCHGCGNVYRYNAVKVLVKLTDSSPRPDYIVCEECAANDSSFVVKPTVEHGIKAGVAVEITTTGNIIEYKRLKNTEL